MRMFVLVELPIKELFTWLHFIHQMAAPTTRKTGDNPVRWHYCTFSVKGLSFCLYESQMYIYIYIQSMYHMCFLLNVLLFTQKTFWLSLFTQTICDILANSAYNFSFHIIFNYLQFYNTFNLYKFTKTYKYSTCLEHNIIIMQLKIFSFLHYIYYLWFYEYMLKNAV